MIQHIRLAYPYYTIAGIVAIVIFMLARKLFWRPVTVRFSLASALRKAQLQPAVSFQRIISYALRLALLVLLAIAVGRPQLVDIQSKVEVEGIDIMLVLDASGSMQCFDDLNDRRPRFEVAKTEAIRFAQKRVDDLVGLIIFGKEAVTRCPLTLDKRIVENIINDMQLGVVDPDGTVLSIALSMAVKRLQDSKAKSKIIILLTDGEPSPEFDIDPEIPIELAKKSGIKIYTIGIGGQEGGLINDPFFGIRPVGLKVNKELLEHIAQKTGGMFFMAERPDDMRRVYDTINALEKTKTQAPIFTQYTELIGYLGIIMMPLMFLELVITTFVWFFV